MMKMKNEIASLLRSLAMIWVLIGLMIVCCFPSYAQVKTGFSIEGSIKGLKTGSKLCIMIKRNDKIDTVAQAVAINGIFKFKDVRLPVYPEFYLICVQTEFVENLRLFLDQEGSIKINGDLEKWPNVTITGSKTHNDFITAKKIIRNVWDKDFAVKHPSESAPSDTILFYSKKGVTEVVSQIPYSYYIPAMLATWTYTSAKMIAPGYLKIPFYNELSEAQKNSYYGKILNNQIADYKENAKFKVALKKSLEGSVSISREQVARELLENIGNKVSSSILTSGTVSLTKNELIAKSRSATLIVNLAYQRQGIDSMRSNPTTAYVIDESGICVTNYHVLKEYSSKDIYQSFSVMTVEGKAYPLTKILACSESNDLVVFQVDTKKDKLSAIPLGNKLAGGQPIHVMAHPLGNFYHFTSGTISGYSTSILAGRSCNIMSITADFNVGSSGGPIIDDCGNVVGTVSRINGGMKIGVPVSELKKLIEFRK